MTNTFRAAARTAARVATGLRYIDVWASREGCDKAFDERIHLP